MCEPDRRMREGWVGGSKATGAAHGRVVRGAAFALTQTHYGGDITLNAFSALLQNNTLLALTKPIKKADHAQRTVPSSTSSDPSTTIVGQKLMCISKDYLRCASPSRRLSERFLFPHFL